MKTFLILISLIFCNASGYDLDRLYWTLNHDTLEFNRIAAEIEWDSSIDPDTPHLLDRVADFQKRKIAWRDDVCNNIIALNNASFLNSTLRRQGYLLCRGPLYTFEEAIEAGRLSDELLSMYYKAHICVNLPDEIKHEDNHQTKVQIGILYHLTTFYKYLDANNITDTGNNTYYLAASPSVYPDVLTANQTVCFNSEDEVNKIMKFTSQVVQKFMWLAWRERLARNVKQPYKQLIHLENIASKRNGYKDIGDFWRLESEVEQFRNIVNNLWNSIEPLYVLLHGVVRFYLRKHYGKIVPARGPIPAHLLGNLWTQNWEHVLDLIFPNYPPLTRMMWKRRWTVDHMLKQADDFYQSLDLPPMPNSFWNQSVLKKINNNTRCHGTAANMYNNSDYRMLYCAGVSMEDFSVIHHEMGHIQYFMAYENQPPIYRQANPILHESIGDTIMLGVMAPQHLHRLGLINDTVLSKSRDFIYNNTGDPFEDDDIFKDMPFYTDDKIHQGFEKVPADEILLLKLALNKVPQIPFSYIMDGYRWAYYSGYIKENKMNEEFWKMVRYWQGIAPPVDRGEEFLDAAAHFHVADNKPFTSYTMSIFLQHQIFEKLCKAAVFGRRDVDEDLPPRMNYHRCDIYGSKVAGKILKDIMSRGDSQNIMDIMKETIGSLKITADAFKRYYRPVFKLLKTIVRTRRISTGW